MDVLTVPSDPFSRENFDIFETFYSIANLVMGDDQFVSFRKCDLDDDYLLFISIPSMSSQLAD